MRTLLFLTLILLPYTGYSQGYKNEVKAMNGYIENARQDWSVPGLAVAIIKDGEVLMAKGFGERTLGSGQKVDEQTIFNIGSTTKAFTAVTVAILVDEGKLKWDDKVSDYMPEFQLYDTYTTRDMRVRDLLTHNLGLPNADYLWYYSGFEPEETLNRMKHLKPAYPLRGGYTYQNIMYLAAGQLVERVSGMSWEEFVDKKVFKVLGMNNTYPNLEWSQKQNNRSVPHAWKYGEEEVITIPDRQFDNIAPAGTIWSSISDMSLWIKSMLDSTKHEGGRLLKPITWVELFKPHTNVPKNQFYPTHRLTNPKWTTYALGWFQQDYDGRNIDFHTGSIDGTIALAGMIRDEGLGYYFLANLDHAEVRHALMYKTFDMFGSSDSDRDWNKDIKGLYGSTTAQQKMAIKRMEDSKVKNTSASMDLETYAGTYESVLWGQITIKFEDGELKATNPVEESLAHYHFDTFLLPLSDGWRAPMMIQFNQAPSGMIRSLSIGGSDAYEFNKK